MTQHVDHTTEQLLSRAQVAARWNLHPETIKRRERAGILPAVRLSSRVVRYRLSDVLALEGEAANGSKATTAQA